MSERLTRHLAIHGRVQGVGYRVAMAHAAEGLGIAGWVRNRGDGSVEAVVQGSAAAVEAITQWAARGPPGAAVVRVDATPGEGEFARFETRATR